MKTLLSFLFISILILLAFCKSSSNQYIKSTGPTYLNVPVADISKDVKSLLNIWYPLLIDTVNGGYWTNFKRDWERTDNQDKMLVTQARGLWTASKAATIFPENPVFKKAAGHGFKFLTEKMWDNTHNGFYQYYFINTPDKKPGEKTAYGNAFALYALSEYAKISNDPAAIEWVKKSFRWLENAAHDPELLGYYNVILPENSNRDNPKYSMGDPNLKDQNSSIHIMEALTNTYHVWPDDLVRKRLAEILELVRNKMVTPKGYLNLFFSKDWKPVSHKDKSRNYIMNNIYTDHVSFGHNIETAFLLIDAAKTLYGNADNITLKVAKKLVDHTLNNGFDKNYYGLFDKGYYFNGSDKIEIVGHKKVWWSQAEALHSLSLMSEYFPNENRYREAFNSMWKYINEQLIDQEYGGWYNNGLDSDPGNKNAQKGHQWKGCYHDGRALMMIYQDALAEINNKSDQK